MFFCKGMGYTSWSQQVKKALVAMAVVVTVGALYQSWPSRSSTAVWSLPSFVSRPFLSSLQTQSSSARERPNLTVSPERVVEVDKALPLPPVGTEVIQGIRTDHDVPANLSTGTVEVQAAGDHGRHDDGSDLDLNFTKTYLAQPSPAPSSGYSRDGESRGSFIDRNLERTVEKLPEIGELGMGVPAATPQGADSKGWLDFLRLNSTEEQVSIGDIDRVVNSTDTALNQTAQGHVETELNSSIISAPVPEKGVDLQLPTTANQRPKWPLSKLEHDLHAVKEAIANAPLGNSVDSDLYAPLYHNLSQFKKSYELMEKIFRVYIYKEGKEPLVHTGPIVGIYSSEGMFIRTIEQNQQFVVKNPDEAHAFFLPYSVANMVTELYVPDSHTMLPLATFIKEYVELIAARHPFWNRTKGGDHFFVSCHDWGPATARDHRELRQNAIKVVCNADSTEEFALAKDASLPEFYLHSEKKLPDEPSLGGPSPSRRPTLAFFAGQMHGRVRPLLLEHWEWPRGAPDMHIFGQLSASEALRLPYVQRLKAAKYCICAMGYEVNSPRIVEAIYADCVPVIIADGFVLPFSDLLDWSAFSITVAEADIPSLRTILQSIPDRRYRSMQRRLRLVRRHFIWHRPPRRYDTFHMILHSVWSSRLRQLPSV